MSHQGIGKFTCKECGHVNIDPKVMDMDEDNSLINCEVCQKWVKWVTKICDCKYSICCSFERQEQNFKSGTCDWYILYEREVGLEG